MKTIQKVIYAIIICILIFNVFTYQIPYNIDITDTEAKDILRKVYMPLEDFIKSGIPLQDKGLLKVPEEVRNKNDFIELFNNKIDNRTLGDFFEELVVEKEGELYIDKTIYIPIPYAENSVIKKCYIKKRKNSLYSYISGKDDIKKDELIIKGKYEMDGDWLKLNNYFIKNENGEWIVQVTTGSTMHGFVDYTQNPYYQGY